MVQSLAMDIHITCLITNQPSQKIRTFFFFLKLESIHSLKRNMTRIRVQSISGWRWVLLQPDHFTLYQPSILSKWVCHSIGCPPHMVNMKSSKAPPHTSDIIIHKPTPSSINTCWGNWAHNRNVISLKSDIPKSIATSTAFLQANASASLLFWTNGPLAETAAIVSPLSLRITTPNPEAFCLGNIAASKFIL